MKFGANLPNYGPATTAGTMLDWARRLEEMGYHQLMVSDHVAPTPEVEHLFPAPFYDPFTVLAWLAGVTSRVRIGTTVTILPYRHPLLVARQVANIDQLSGGRFVFGAAAGWAAGEFAALGVPYARRGARSDEYLRVMKAFWTRDVVAYDGEFVRFGPVHTGPRPVQPSGPPVWIGGHSAGALRRAARYGDAWHPTSVTADWLVHVGLPALRDTAKRLNLAVPALAPRIKLRLTGRPLPAGRVLGEGSLEQIHDDLVLLDRLGADTVVLDPTFPGQRRDADRDAADLAAFERLAKEVIDLEHGRLR
ncbi:TIGR03619 family F420-dependent LLM class oxidoreductase [Streptomyces sp. ID05-04B]|uniref:TIGR03619 family F420-dependent LLM class oxidoreductase n=1 Tax=unclassified Streptomyces TaxID=2593676 RepID=UPI000D1ADD0A|nr:MULTISPECIES: TIGR03619 family F420-dependent LLM class oxidoreductase [unclassified Streptomyces]AVV46729.1 LLM class F420-dependent oxidoreductase [Streptomyces sp. P3]MDX5570138.1 TIGR03619 family F420-dependent LLM class oxidoreductase [Streptomyces sp. ID05-04B]